MRFSQYLDNNWDSKKFCHDLAVKARVASYKFFVEMAMATEEIDNPKKPILYDHDDYKFLSQFPYEVWGKALNWRYNEGLRTMMSHQNPDDPTHIPENWNWTNHLAFDMGKGKHYVFGNPDDPEKTIYIGLTDLVKKLTKPHKGRPGYVEYHQGKVHPHWAGEGPSLKEIDPNQTDPTHPAHPSNYKHGLYNFDLSNMAEISDQDIEDVPDTEIQAWLAYPLSEEDVDSPEVQKAIKRIRERMKKVKKHTFSGFDVPQESTTAKNIADWIRTNAKGLYGTHPPTHADTLTGEEHAISHMTPAEINKIKGQGFLSKKDPKTGEFSLKEPIPTIKKKLNFHEIKTDKNGKTTMIDRSGTYTIPHLNPIKTLPQLRGEFELSKHQRAELARRTNPEFDWNPDKETMAEAKARIAGKLGKKKGADFVNSTRPGTLKNLIRNWDILTEPQQKFIRENAKTLHHMARHVHGKSEETNDQYADPKNVYAAGFRPNFKTPGQGKLNVPPDKMEEFIAEYFPKIFAEVYGDKQAGGGQGYQSMGKMDKFLKQMAKSGRYAPQVIDALENRLEELATFASYNLLTWLNDPVYGIKDPKYGLLDDVDENEYDAEANEDHRNQKVQNFLRGASQIGFNDVLSRRRREAFGVATMGELDKAGSSGKTSAGEVPTGGKKTQVIDFAAKRRWLHSDPSSAARAGQKSHNLTAQVPEFFALRRRQILQKLQGSPTAAAALAAAEKKIQSAIELAIEIYQKYDKELAATIPDPKKREEAVLKYVHEALLKNTSFSDIEAGEVLQKTKTLAATAQSSPYDNKIRAAMDAFLEKFMKLNTDKGESIRMVTYDPTTHDIAETRASVSPNTMPAKPSTVSAMITQLYQYPNLIREAMKKWGFKIYEKIYNAHDTGVEKSDAELEEEEKKLAADWAAEEQKMDSLFASKFKQQAETEPIKMPQQQQAAAQQPQQQQAAQALSQPLPQLYDLADKVGNVTDIMKLGNAFLSKKAELMAQSGSGHMLQQAVDAMKKRRMAFAVQQVPEEYTLWKSLSKLVGELHATHS